MATRLEYQQFKIEKLWVPIITALVTAGVAIGTAWITARSVATDEVKTQTQPLSATTVGNLRDGQKMCIVHGPEEKWRDSVIVPKQWTYAICTHFMTKSGAAKIQLGCVFENDMYLGEIFDPRNARIPVMFPVRNCGW
jgi:hypothetical protein